MVQQQRSQQISQGSQTIPQESSNELPVLHLTATDTDQQQEDEGTTRRVRWTEDTVDNELMNKKKSKICCIFHPNSTEYEEESDSNSDNSSSSSSDSSSDGENDGVEDFNRRKLKEKSKKKKKQAAKHKKCNHDHEHDHEHKHVHDHEHEHDHSQEHKHDDEAKEEVHTLPLPNAYEYQPKFRLVKDLEEGGEQEKQNEKD